MSTMLTIPGGYGCIGGGIAVAIGSAPIVSSSGDNMRLRCAACGCYVSFSERDNEATFNVRDGYDYTELYAVEPCRRCLRAAEPSADCEGWSALVGQLYKELTGLE